MADYTRAEMVRRIATMGCLHLAGADLSGLDLSGMTLVGADLSYADLTASDLTDAQLSGASLWSTRAQGARFRQANLSGACLGLSDLSGADLRQAQLDLADLTGARMDGADLAGAQLRGAWLDTMQRALAINAPPLRYPAVLPGRATRVLSQAQLGPSVTLRCGDQLELHLDRPRSTVRVEGAPILTRPRKTGASVETGRVMAFSAIAPGRTRLVVNPGERGRAPLAIEVVITP